LPQISLPLAQIARLLDVSEEDLRALLAERTDVPGDPTLVGLTVAEAARRIGIGRTKMYEFVASGEIRSVKIGTLRRIPAEAVSDFLAQRSGSGDLVAAA
jgi:excisionase family DNA binding protein